MRRDGPILSGTQRRRRSYRPCRAATDLTGSYVLSADAELDSDCQSLSLGYDHFCSRPTFSQRSTRRLSPIGGTDGTSTGPISPDVRSETNVKIHADVRIRAHSVVKIHTVIAPFGRVALLYRTRGVRVYLQRKLGAIFYLLRYKPRLGSVS